MLSQVRFSLKGQNHKSWTRGYFTHLPSATENRKDLRSNAVKRAQHTKLLRFAFKWAESDPTVSLQIFSIDEIVDGM